MGKIVLEPITPGAIRRANARGEATNNAPTAVVDADIERVERALHLRLVFRDRTRLSIPLDRIAELAAAKPSALKRIEVSPALDSLSFPSLDVDIYATGLLHDLYSSSILAEQGRIGGKRSTPAKTAAVRENGSKGGRPRKSAIK